MRKYVKTISRDIKGTLEIFLFVVAFMSVFVLNTNVIAEEIMIAPGDIEGPQLISFTLDKSEVQVGDTINFMAEIADESDLSYAEFQFKCGADYHNVFLKKSEGDIYKGSLVITDSFLDGEYRISWIALRDYADNSSSPSSNVSFNVTNNNSKYVAPGDTSGPNLVSFILDKSEVNVGDTIHFTAEIEDESDLSYAEFQFKCGADYHNVFLERLEGNIYSGSLLITERFLFGTYNVSWIALQDYAGNNTSPSSNKSFTVRHYYSDWLIKNEATCTETGLKEKVCKDCGDTIEEIIPALGHDWNKPSYKWNEGNSSVLAKRICNNNAAHVEEEIATTSAEITKEATYIEKGETTYTAIFKNDAFEKQIKTVADIPQLEKLKQPMDVKTTTKTLKVKKLKKKAITITVLAINNNVGTVSYKITGGNSKSKKALKINKKNGKITVKKKTKKGTYKIKVTVTASGTDEYEAGSKTVTVTVKVK